MFWENSRANYVVGAQGDCDVAKPGYYEARDSIEPHSPRFARILGPAANSIAFKEAFGCPDKKPTCAIF